MPEMRGNGQLGTTTMSVSIGKVFAICDHFEMHTGNPLLASRLKQLTGVSRSQLRQWVREGRLNEYNATNDKGQLQKAYTRPKPQQEVSTDGEMDTRIY